MSTRPSISQVFTPRRTDVNREIYVVRPELEKELIRGLQGSLHVIVFGESGSGKSWLYKKVLSDLSAQVMTANCANALRLGSFKAELNNLVALGGERRLSEMKEEKSAKAKLAVAEGELKTTRTYDYVESDALFEAFQLLREKAGEKVAVLVVDNLEMIFSSESLMDELASIITLLDDSRYSAFNVKLLIVGVPRDVKKYLANRHASVGNRISEISEVSSLSEDQVAEIVETGFVKLLKASIDSEFLKQWQKHVFEVTMGFAQPVQEYCEQLAYSLEDQGWVATGLESLQDADDRWLKQGLVQASGVITQWMNERETKIGRRNQVLYSLGKIRRRVFHVSDIENMVRAEFPTTTSGITLAVGQILGELSSGENAIIKSSTKDATYEFKDSRFAMALRVLLVKDAAKERITISS